MVITYHRLEGSRLVIIISVMGTFPIISMLVQVMVWNSQNQPLAHMAFQTTPTTSQAPTHQLLLPVALPLEVLIPPKISQILRLVLWDITTIWKITLQASGASQALQLTAMSLKLITILLTQSQFRLH